jgi:hypothetical protein
MINVTTSGSWQHTSTFLQQLRSQSYLTSLEKYGAQGVDALRRFTPEKSGRTAESWGYEIIQKPGYYAIKWTNSDVVEPGHIPVAVLIQYGHGTREGGYVQGVDYINPAMRPIFEQILAEVWREVTK